jgi:hypothetical protein
MHTGTVHTIHTGTEDNIVDFTRGVLSSPIQTEIGHYDVVVTKTCVTWQDKLASPEPKCCIPSIEKDCPNSWIFIHDWISCHVVSKNTTALHSGCCFNGSQSGHRPRRNLVFKRAVRPSEVLLYDRLFGQMVATLSKTQLPEVDQVPASTIYSGSNNYNCNYNLLGTALAGPAL